MPRPKIVYRRVPVEAGAALPAEIILLRRIGEALYGPDWQTPLAEDLGISIKSVQRWSAGLIGIAPERWEEMLVILRARRPGVLEYLNRRRDELNDVEFDLMQFQKEL